MKRTLLKSMMMTLLVVSTALLSTGCKKDGDGGDNNANGSYTYLDKTITLRKADWHLTDDTKKQLHIGIQGSGGALDIVFLNDVPELKTGTFTLNKDHLGASFDPSKHFANCVISQGTNIHSVTGGSFTVSKNGDNYTIAFDLNTEHGNAKGSYTGGISPRFGGAI